MVTTYGGFKFFTLPRNGGHFVRMRMQHWPYKKRESPFTETAVFDSEADAIREAKRLVDDTSSMAQAAPAA